MPGNTAFILRRGPNTVANPFVYGTATSSAFVRAIFRAILVLKPVLMIAALSLVRRFALASHRCPQSPPDVPFRPYVVVGGLARPWPRCPSCEPRPGPTTCRQGSHWSPRWRWNTHNQYDTIGYRSFVWKIARTAHDRSVFICR